MSGRTRVRSHYRRTRKGVTLFEIAVGIVVIVLLIAAMR